MPAKAKKSDDEELASFAAICHAARKLMATGRLRVRILYPSRVDLRVSKDDLQTTAAVEDIDVTEFRRTLDSQVAPLMAATLSGDKSMWPMLVGMSAGDEPADFKTAAARVEARRRLVEQELVTQRLRDRYLLKQTSKTNPLTGWHWEITAKEYDDREGPLASLRHATVRFHAHRRTGRYDESASDYFPQFVQAHAVEAFSFDCDLEDAEELQDAFARIVRELKAREKAEPEAGTPKEG